MKKVNERDFDYRNGDNGPKYMIRGPSIDWGLMVLKPGQEMGAHGHKEVDETFYFLEGQGEMVVDGVAHEAIPGDAFLVDAEEMHAIRNTGDGDLKLVFIKSLYRPDDKI